MSEQKSVNGHNQMGATEDKVISSKKEFGEDDFVVAPISEEKKRLRWIDQARGFIMLYLVITSVWPPSAWKSKENNIIFHYLFGHPGSRENYMTIFDIGAAAFIFMLGFMMAVSFRSRSEKLGKSAAFKHFIIRYGLLFVLGLIIANVPNFEFIRTRDDYGYPIVVWDVILSIAVAGIISFPFILIKDLKYRLAAGYIWVFIYQILMNYAGFKEYAQNSVHGGIFGTVFGYASISIVASVVGEYILKTKVPGKQKYKNMAIFGAVNLIIGIIIAEISIAFPEIGWEASKRQVSFTHNLISIGTTVLGLCVFAYLDLKKDKKLTILQAYGMNPFFVYFIVVIPVFLLDEIIGDDLGLGWIGNMITLAVIFAYTYFIMMRLFKKKNVISTEKATLYFLLTAVVLAVLLLSLGIL